jgi:hypothetical protein
MKSNISLMNGGKAGAVLNRQCTPFGVGSITRAKEGRK